MAKRRGNISDEILLEYPATHDALVSELRELQDLPATYKDLVIGSPEWLRWGQLLPHRKNEMRAWATGPIYCFGKPTEYEKDILGKDRKYGYAEDKLKDPHALTFDILVNKLINADSEDFTLAYFHWSHVQLAHVLNVCLSKFGHAIRCKNRIHRHRRK